MHKQSSDFDFVLRESSQGWCVIDLYGAASHACSLVHCREWAGALIIAPFHTITSRCYFNFSQEKTAPEYNAAHRVPDQIQKAPLTLSCMPLLLIVPCFLLLAHDPDCSCKSHGIFLIRLDFISIDTLHYMYRENSVHFVIRPTNSAI